MFIFFVQWYFLFTSRTAKYVHLMYIILLRCHGENRLESFSRKTLVKRTVVNVMLEGLEFILLPSHNLFAYR